MKRMCLTLLCIVVTMLSAGILNAQETRMVPEYRCLWIGPQAGSWTNPQGDPNAVWQLYKLSSWTDPQGSGGQGYLINWTLVENPSFTWPDFISMAEIKGGATVSVDSNLPSPIQGLVIRDANLIVNKDMTVVGDWQDDGFMAVCVGQGANGTLIINSGTLTCGSSTGPLPGQTGPIIKGDGNSRFFVGRAINATDSAKGTVNQYGGTVRVANQALQIGDIDYGEARELLGGYEGWGTLSTEGKVAIAATSSGSSYNIYDGNLVTNGNIEVGKANGSHGIFNVYGGDVNAVGVLRVWFDGEMTMDGGTVYVGGGLVWPRRSPSQGVLTLRKGSLSVGSTTICEDGIGVSEINLLGGSFDCRGAWEARGSAGTARTQQSIKIDCGKVERVHFGSLDAALDAGDKMTLTLVVPKNTDPNNAATKIFVDGNVTFNATTSIHIDVSEDFAGQVGDAWDLVIISGNVMGLEQVAIVNDNPRYTFTVHLEEDVKGTKFLVAKLTDIATAN